MVDSKFLKIPKDEFSNVGENFKEIYETEWKPSSFICWRRIFIAIILVTVGLIIFFVALKLSLSSPDTSGHPEATDVPNSNTEYPGDDQEQERRLTASARMSAVPNSWPWVATLMVGGQSVCGGALITDHHVLTAASCVQHLRSATSIAARLVERKSAIDEARHKDYVVKEIKPHEGFDRVTSQHDIAILVLQEKVIGSIQPATLPPAGFLYAGQNATVTWFGPPEATTLEKISVSVWDNRDCGDVYRKKNFEIFTTNLCVSSSPGHKQLELGFAGAPLLSHTSSRGSELIGIESRTARNSVNSAIPVVYTRVNKYLQWISNAIETPLDKFLPRRPEEVLVNKHLTRYSVRVVSSPRRQSSVSSSSDSKPCCGGVLISDRHMLTAAHCFRKCSSKHASIAVRLTEHDFATDEYRHKDYAVQEAKWHEDFDYYTSKHDIAILVLEEKVSGSVLPASLPPAGPLYALQEATSTGFERPEATELEEISVVVWDNNDCSDVYREKGTPIYDTFLCASSLEGEKDVSKGFSGGSVQLYTPSRGWEVIGVVSWRIRSDTLHLPVVYTRVNKYLDWIGNATVSAGGI